jgi:phosphatidylglycerophosphatase GEP4
VQYLLLFFTNVRDSCSNTYCDELHHTVEDKVKEALEKFPSAVAILSNSIGSSDDRNYSGADRVERNLGLPVIRHLEKKPACIKEVRRSILIYNRSMPL